MDSDICTLLFSFYTVLVLYFEKHRAYDECIREVERAFS